MDYIVDERFRIKIYLDTNILVDYVEGENLNLKKSLEYLSKSKFVCFRSSHYVEFEFVEVRKKRAFYKKVKGGYPTKDQHLHMASCNWKIDTVDYNSVKEEVKEQVLDDIKKIKSNLKIDFDDHVLHEKLIIPTRELCLETKISREDSLVFISCAYPKMDEILDFCVIFSNDKQYDAAYKENQNDIKKILEKIPLHAPVFLNAKKIPNISGGFIDLNTSQNIKNLEELWNNELLNLIKLKEAENYLGTTLKTGEKAKDLIYIDIGKKKHLYDSQGLVFISKNLDYCLSINKDFDYWQNQQIVLPYINQADTTFSLKPQMEKVQNDLFNTKGNLVFYEDKLDSTYTYDIHL